VPVLAYRMVAVFLSDKDSMPTISRPAALLAALAALGGLLCGIAWALASPVGASPDEGYHLTSIWCAGDDDPALCRPAPDTAEGLPQVSVPGLVGQGPCYAYRNDLSAECQDALPRRVATPLFDMGEYPGGFYGVMRVFAGDQVGRSVVVMRVVNVALAVVLGLALWAFGTPVARRLLVYTVTAVLIPLGWFMLASVNPTSWTVTGIGVVGFALHSLFLVERRGQQIGNAVLALVGTLLAVLSRGDATIYVAVVSIAVCVLHWRTLTARPRLLIVPGVACAIAAVFLLGASQVASVAGATAETDRSRSEVVVSLLLEFPALVTGMFGYGFGLGWLDTPVHAVTAAVALATAGFLFLSGIGFGGRAKAAAVVMLGGAMLAIPLLTLYRLRLIVGESVQPRYILPLMPVLLLVVLTGAGSHQGLRLSRVQSWAMWIMLSGAQSAAIYANMRRYVTGIDGPIVIEDTEWWWQAGPGPVATWIVGSVGFAALAFAVVLLSRPVPRPADRRGTPDRPTTTAGERPVQDPRTSESATLQQDPPVQRSE
jgi:hypothetical protein